MSRHLSLTTGTSRPRAAAITALAVVVSFAALRADAASVSEKMQVSAIVKAAARLESAAFPARLQVTAADVARGYVETLVPVTYRSNDPSGVMIRMGLATETFGKAAVRWGAVEMRVDGSEAFIAQPFAGLGPQTVTMVCRLELNAGTAPASYDWPLSISVSPVQQW